MDEQPQHSQGTPTDEQPQHPKGALTFMLIYLVFITLIWLNAYLRLWLKG